MSPTPTGRITIVAAADYDNDGNEDLLWYDFSSGKIVTWCMDASVVRITGQLTNPAANTPALDWTIVGPKSGRPCYGVAGARLVS